MPKVKPATPPTAKSIGARLRAAREAAGLTQVELAERLKTSQNAISAYERGKRAPGAIMLWHWARALGVEPGELIG